MTKIEVGMAVKPLDIGIFRHVRGRVTALSDSGKTATVRDHFGVEYDFIADMLEPDYPELRAVARRIAHEVGAVISQNVQGVESQMPYKAQYVLEEVIKILQEAV